jgi:major membrane immunogen (membrane-anchored lipoprotein)
MKTYTTVLPVVLFANLILLGACKSTKVNKGSVNNLAQTPVAVNVCDQTIKYYSEKVRSGKTGEEVAAQSEITINPVAKTITIASYVPSESERKSFVTVIESSDCNLNSDITSGQSVYRGYIKQLDGSTTKSYVNIEAKDGGITLSNADPDRRNDFAIIISKWEVVK